MHYKQNVVIDLPVARVVELFDSPEYTMMWFPGLVSFEHLSGEPGTVGAKSRMLFEMPRGEFELIETITVSNLPDELSGQYETVGKGMTNTMSNRFTPVNENSTLYESEIDYRFDGLKWRLLSPFVRLLFKRQSGQTMQLFREFAECNPAGPVSPVDTGPDF